MTVQVKSSKTSAGSDCTGNSDKQNRSIAFRKLFNMKQAVPLSKSRTNKRQLETQATSITENQNPNRLKKQALKESISNSILSVKSSGNSHINQSPKIQVQDPGPSNWYQLSRQKAAISNSKAKESMIEKHRVMRKEFSGKREKLSSRTASAYDNKAWPSFRIAHVGLVMPSYEDDFVSSDSIEKSQKSIDLFLRDIPAKHGSSDLKLVSLVDSLFPSCARHYPDRLVELSMELNYLVDAELYHKMDLESEMQMLPEMDQMFMEDLKQVKDLDDPGFTKTPKYAGNSPNLISPLEALDKHKNLHCIRRILNWDPENSTFNNNAGASSPSNHHLLLVDLLRPNVLNDLCFSSGTIKCINNQLGELWLKALRSHVNTSNSVHRDPDHQLSLEKFIFNPNAPKSAIQKRFCNQLSQFQSMSCWKQLDLMSLRQKYGISIFSGIGVPHSGTYTFNQTLFRGNSGFKKLNESSSCLPKRPQMPARCMVLVGRSNSLLGAVVSSLANEYGYEPRVVNPILDMTANENSNDLSNNKSSGVSSSQLLSQLKRQLLEFGTCNNSKKSRGSLLVFENLELLSSSPQQQSCWSIIWQVVCQSKQPCLLVFSAQNESDPDTEDKREYNPIDTEIDCVPEWLRSRINVGNPPMIEGWWIAEDKNEFDSETGSDILNCLSKPSCHEPKELDTHFSSLASAWIQNPWIASGKVPKSCHLKQSISSNNSIYHIFRQRMRSLIKQAQPKFISARTRSSYRKTQAKNIESDKPNQKAEDYEIKLAYLQACWQRFSSTLHSHPSVEFVIRDRQLQIEQNQCNSFQLDMRAILMQMQLWLK